MLMTLPVHFMLHIVPHILKDLGPLTGIAWNFWSERFMRPLKSMNHATRGQSVNIMRNYSEQVVISCFRLAVFNTHQLKVMTFCYLNSLQDDLANADNVYTFN